MPEPSDFEPDSRPDVKVVGFLDNCFAVLQPRRGGHKSGLDAVLLAAMVPDGFCGLAADFGAGNGTAGMAVAQRCPNARVDLVENNPAAHAMILEALELPQNAHLSKRLNAHLADVTDLLSLKSCGLQNGSHDQMIINPPFNDSTHRSSPDRDRALAHNLPPDGLKNWISTASCLLRPKGQIALILRPANIAGVLVALESHFGGIALKPVHPKHDQPANRILVAATKTSKAALRLLPGLVLHNPDGSFTGEVEEILRGRQGITL